MQWQSSLQQQRQPFDLLLVSLQWLFGAAARMATSQLVPRYLATFHIHSSFQLQLKYLGINLHDRRHELTNQASAKKANTEIKLS
jgi:hypothetical protein